MKKYSCDLLELSPLSIKTSIQMCTVFCYKNLHRAPLNFSKVVLFTVVSHESTVYLPFQTYDCSTRDA